MAKKINEKIVEPIYNVNRFYNQGQSEVAGYIVLLRIGQWTEEVRVLSSTHWGKEDIETLKKNIKEAKDTLWAKYELFAEMFPEVNTFGENKIGNEIRQKLDLPQLTELTTDNVPSYTGEVVA